MKAFAACSAFKLHNFINFIINDILIKFSENQMKAYAARFARGAF
jgi:hypothetical protein